MRLLNISDADEQNSEELMAPDVVYRITRRHEYTLAMLEIVTIDF